jgi:predicted PurR-regulated permease PerM
VDSVTNPAPNPGSGSALRLAAEVAPAVLVLGALLYTVREVLSPLVLLALLLLVLWPERRQPFVGRLLIAAVTVTVLWILSVTGSLLAPFLLGLAFAYLLAPVVSGLVRHRIPRALAIVLTLLPFLGGVVLLLVLLVPAIERQVVDLAARLPALLQQFGQWLLDLRTRFLASGPGFLTEEQAAWLQNLQAGDLVAMVQQRWSSIGQGAWAAFLGMGKGLGTAVTLVMYLVVTPVVTFYLLASWERFTGGLANLVPPDRRDDVFAFLLEYDRLLGRYVRGTLIQAGLVGIVTGGGLAILGFPGALLVGVIWGLGNVIPYFGLALSVIPAVLLALVSGAVAANLLKLAVVVVVQQVLEAITGPRIVGSAVGLNPVWVMISIGFFSVLLGFVGLLLAIPLAILVRIVVERAIARYRQSDYFGGAAQEAAPTVEG